MLADEVDYVIGVDTHRDQHTLAVVVASTGAVADALSTAFFVMNESDVAAFCSAHPEIGAALTGPDGSLIVLGALRGPAGFSV